MSKLYVTAAPGIKLPIPRSLGLAVAGYFPEDKPVRVANSHYIRRRLAEGSLVEAKAPQKPKAPAAPKASPPTTLKPRS